MEFVYLEGDPADSLSNHLGWAEVRVVQGADLVTFAGAADGEAKSAVPSDVANPDVLGDVLAIRIGRSSFHEVFNSALSAEFSGSQS